MSDHSLKIQFSTIQMRLLSAQYFGSLCLKFQKQKNVGFSSKSLQMKILNAQIHSDFKYFTYREFFQPPCQPFLQSQSIILEHFWKNYPKSKNLILSLHWDNFKEMRHSFCKYCFQAEIIYVESFQQHTRTEKTELQLRNSVFIY